VGHCPTFTEIKIHDPFSKAIFLEEISYKVYYLAGVGVPPGCQFGVEFDLVCDDLELSTIGRYQGDRLDISLEMLQQIGCQTGSAVGVMSNRAVGNRQFQHLLLQHFEWMLL